MDKGTARAVALALAMFYLQHTRYMFRTLFETSDRFAKYIYEGIWPKEAVEQLGKGKDEEGGKEGESRIWPEV
jgi:hypothetical protein